MAKEKLLSEKRCNWDGNEDYIYEHKDVKKAVERLKEMLREELIPDEWYKGISRKIDKIMGEFK